MEKSYIKLSSNFNSLNKRIESGELKWSHYAVEDEIGYHYYEILK